MNGEICGDNRFEIIEKAKQAILEKTNIKTNKTQMAELDSFLFRCWQMGWLKKYEQENENKVLLYAANKIEENIKRKLIEKAIKWLDENVDNYCFNTGNRYEYIPKVGRQMLKAFKQVMEE